MSSHFKRVWKYARPSDYASGAGWAALGPIIMLAWERVAPAGAGKGAFPPIMRLTGAISVGAGLLLTYQSSLRTLKPFREIDRA
jgi:hypothetical protein